MAPNRKNVTPISINNPDIQGLKPHCILNQHQNKYVAVYSVKTTVEALTIFKNLLSGTGHISGASFCILSQNRVALYSITQITAITKIEARAIIIRTEKQPTKLSVP
jgi:hypothetical protein